MKRIVFDGSAAQVKLVFDEYGSGNLSVVCPKCLEEAIVITTNEDIIKHQRAPGVYCPHDHFILVMNRSSRFPKPSQ